VDNFRNRHLRFATNSRGSIALKCFVKIGKGLLYVTGFCLAVATFTLVWMVIVDISIAEDDNRRKSLEAKGFITKAADFSKKHKGFIKCEAEEYYACQYTKDGKIYREELK